MTTKVLEIKHYGGIEYNEFKEVNKCYECEHVNLFQRCMHQNFTHVDPFKELLGKQLRSICDIPEWCPLPNKVKDDK